MPEDEETGPPLGDQLVAFKVRTSPPQLTRSVVEVEHPADQGADPRGRRGRERLNYAGRRCLQAATRLPAGARDA